MQKVECNKWSSFVSSRPDCVSVCSFNTLRRNYRFRSNYWCDDAIKSWDNRKELHRKLFDAIACDILCLQECELTTLEEDYDFLLCSYDVVSAGVAKKDQHSFTKPSIFYLKDKFDCLWVERRSRAVLVELKDKKSFKRFFVVSVHLSGGQEKGDDRDNQVRSALKYLKTRMAVTDKAHNANNDNNNDNNNDDDEKEVKPSVFFCGDFNCFGDEKIPDLLKAEGLHCEIQRSHIPFTHKWGTAKDVSAQFIDFIYSNEKCEAFRDPFDEDTWKALKEEGIPSMKIGHPSDHVPVCALYRKIE